MKRIIIGVLISMLVLSSFIGAFTSATAQKKSMDPDPIRDFSHNVLGEYFTLTTCVPCKYSHTALKIIYANGWYPFYYVTYVSDANNNSRQRKNELNVVGSPTEVWDGGYKYNIGGSESTEEEMVKFNYSIPQCGARDVKDIDIDLNVEWLGAVNIHPEDGEILVPIETVLNWTISEMKIDIDVTNNEAEEYNGHVHVQVTEVNSTWYDDKFGYPYTFEFKSYAYNDDTPIDAGDTWSETIYYDGVEHHDADDPPNYFDHITEENIQVIATAFDKDNDKYVDECAGVRVGDETDPKTFDVYFGDSNPPPLVINNGSVMKYDPFGDLNWSTTYYWKIDIWNDKGELKEGEILSFTTRGNVPPNTPVDIDPTNGSTTAPIDTNLTWLCVDTDGDDVTFDIYFDEFDPFINPKQVESNWTGKTYDPTPFGQTLEFDTKYGWKIVAWDEYGLNSSGPLWNFVTEPNYAPNKAYDPRPPNGANNVPGNAVLFWNGSDPNSGDTLTYDVYFGPNPDPPLVEYDQDEDYYDPYDAAEMPLYKEFFWRIDTRDKEGLLTTGDDWTFETGENEPPTDPVIDGPIEGIPDTDYTFTFKSTDPLNQKIKYEVDWGDGDTFETELYPSGKTINLTHSWAEKKTYIISVTAIDEYGGVSNETQHEILIPRNRAVSYNYNILNWLSERFPFIFQLLQSLFGL